MIRKIASIVLCILLVVIQLSGCGARVKQVTNIPTNPVTGQPIATQGEVQLWFAATGNLKVLSQFTKNATDEVVKWNRAGFFPDGPHYATTLRALGRAALVEKQAADFLEEQPQHFGLPIQEKFRTLVGQIGSAIQEALENGTLGIKNEQSKGTFLGIVTSIQSVITIMFNLVQTVSSPPGSSQASHFILTEREALCVGFSG